MVHSDQSNRRASSLPKQFSSSRTVGYTGGGNPKPSYETVCGGDGHTEAWQQVLLFV